MFCSILVLLAPTRTYFIAWEGRTISVLDIYWMLHMFLKTDCYLSIYFPLAIQLQQETNCISEKVMKTLLIVLLSPFDTLHIFGLAGSSRVALSWKWRYMVVILQYWIGNSVGHSCTIWVLILHNFILSL